MSMKRILFILAAVALLLPVLLVGCAVSPGESGSTDAEIKASQEQIAALETELRASEAQVTGLRKQIIELAKLVKNPSESPKYPASLNTKAKRAIFDNLGMDEELALLLDKEIRNNVPDSWRGNLMRERTVKQIIYKHVPEYEVDRIFEIIKNQKEY